ncbi:MAG TPA: exodeoxyribonuclease VII small subunit [bacterium]|nr:exodeoxyribonuclease VII small subunit [bacterium]HOL66598.1 exodeoxyribonuclease VII small subunit [bacterium]HPP11901.1 exodeoxyribonuclease VII small subunit [bacterium]
MEKMNYRQALEELQQILEEIENQQVDVDVLAERVKRAAFLIKWCQARLRKTETEVKKVLAEMEEKPDQNSQEKE